jgi:hypothetical protein
VINEWRSRFCFHLRPSTEALTPIETLAKPLLAETEDAEVHYRLRTALQLLDVHKTDRPGAVAEDDDELTNGSGSGATSDDESQQQDSAVDAPVLSSSRDGVSRTDPIR